MGKKLDSKTFIIKIIQLIKGTLLGKVALLLVGGGVSLLGAAPYFDKYIGAAITNYLSIEVSDPSISIAWSLIVLGVGLSIWDRVYDSKVKNRGHGENYYAHVNEFESYMLKLGKTFDDVDFQGVRRLYSVLFPNAKNGDFSISEDLIDNIRYLVFHLADTEVSYNPSYRNRYRPEIDVHVGVESGSGYEITSVNFMPRAEVFMTGLYGLFGIIDKGYIEKVFANNTEDVRKYKIIKEYNRLAAILKLVIDFSANDNSDFIPGSYQELYNLNLKKYKKSIIKKNKVVKVTYFPFGMVHKVSFV